MLAVRAILVYETDEVLLLHLKSGVAQGNMEMGQAMNVIFHPGSSLMWPRSLFRSAEAKLAHCILVAVYTGIKVAPVLLEATHVRGPNHSRQEQAILAPVFGHFFPTANNCLLET